MIPHPLLPSLNCSAFQIKCCWNLLDRMLHNELIGFRLEESLSKDSSYCYKFDEAVKEIALKCRRILHGLSVSSLL